VATVATRLRAPSGPQRRGFTLVEMLVVLLLLGIAAALVTLRIDRDDRHLLQQEATRFAGALEQASATAQWQAITLGVSAEGGTYRFWRRDGDGQWHVIAQDEVLAPRALPEGIEIHPQHYAGAVVPANAILPFRASGRNDPYDIAMITRDWIARIASDPLNRVSFDIAPRSR